MHVTWALLIVLVGLLLGLLAVGFLKGRSQKTDDDLTWAGGDLFLLGLMALAVLFLGVFVASILLGPSR